MGLGRWRFRGVPSLPVIVFIPHSGVGGKSDQTGGEWLPRQCPACGQMAVIGHGRRRRQAHDETHAWISVRRGFCKMCARTLTALPAWCVPGAPYSLRARQQALAQLAQDQPVQQAAPHCRDPDRLPDAATVRRWFWRRMQGLLFWAGPPTLFAWDWRAASRMLISEAFSP